MREDICTIPISEVFEPKDGCPICRMRNQLERRMVEYITGAAMMEPDVRMETNRLGFCRHHFQMMLAQRNRLSVALTLESHLKELQKDFDAIAERGASKGQPLELLKREASCFVCDKVQWGMERMLATIFRLWQGEPDFAKLYGEQPCLCLPHAAVLLQEGQKQIHKKKYGDFSKVTAQLAKKYLDEVTGDISKYCSMYDYRNAGGDWGSSRDSIERAVWFLTSYPPAAATEKCEKKKGE